MNGFLVMVRYTDADLPVRLFASCGQAEEFARDLTRHQLEEAAKIIYHVGGDARFVYLIEMLEGAPCGARQLKRFF